MGTTQLPSDLEEELTPTVVEKRALRYRIDLAIATNAILSTATVMLPLELGADIVCESARLASFLDTATLPYRRSILMDDWCSILSPRADLRILSGCTFKDFWTPNPLAPAVASSDVWSRLMVGRGLPSSSWPCADLRAERFEYEAVLVPKHFPSSIFPEAHDRTASSLVEVGCSNAILPWLSSLASTPSAKGSAFDTARREGSLGFEEATALSQDLCALSDAYSQ